MYGPQGFRAFTSKDERSHVDAIADGADPSVVVAQIKRNAAASNTQVEESVRTAMSVALNGGQARDSLGMEGVRAARVQREQAYLVRHFGASTDEWRKSATKEATRRYGAPTDNAQLAQVDAYVSRRMAERSEVVARVERILADATRESLAENKALVAEQTTRRLAETNVAAAMASVGETVTRTRVIDLVKRIGTERAATMKGEAALRLVTMASVA